MPKKPINTVLAENLGYYMSQSKELRTQAQLAQKVGVVQRTIGNYLRPELRQPGSRGKHPSAKLSEVEQIADALEVEVWQLLRPMSEADRIIYRKIEEAFSAVLAMNRPPDAPPVNTAQPESGENQENGVSPTQPVTPPSQDDSSDAGDAVGKQRSKTGWSSKRALGGKEMGTLVRPAGDPNTGNTGDKKKRKPRRTQK